MLNCHRWRAHFARRRTCRACTADAAGECRLVLWLVNPKRIVSQTRSLPQENATRETSIQRPARDAAPVSVKSRPITTFLILPRCGRLRASLRLALGASALFRSFCCLHAVSSPLHLSKQRAAWIEYWHGRPTDAAAPNQRIPALDPHVQPRPTYASTALVAGRTDPACAFETERRVRHNDGLRLRTTERMTEN